MKKYNETKKMVKKMTAGLTQQQGRSKKGKKGKKRKGGLPGLGGMSMSDIRQLQSMMKDM